MTSSKKRVRGEDLLRVESAEILSDLNQLNLSPTLSVFHLYFYSKIKFLHDPPHLSLPLLDEVLPLNGTP